jgi:hypothetical protein
MSSVTASRGVGFGAPSRIVVVLRSTKRSLDGLWKDLLKGSECRQSEPTDIWRNRRAGLVW